MTHSEQSDTLSPEPAAEKEDKASATPSPTGSDVSRDPRQTEHPVGQEQAQRNADDEPVS